MAEADILWVSNSDCKGNEKSTFIDDEEKLIIQSSGENTYTVSHRNVVFNCCLPEGITVELTVANDTIYFNEKEKVPGECRCLCNYDLSSEIGNLIKGEYVLCLMKESDRLGTITLMFGNNMYEEFMVSELKDYPYL